MGLFNFIGIVLHFIIYMIFCYGSGYVLVPTKIPYAVIQCKSRSDHFEIDVLKKT